MPNWKFHQLDVTYNFWKKKNKFYLILIFFRGPETQIIDYITQQYKLFPSLATCFALSMASGSIWELYNNVNAELDQGELERLPEVKILKSS